VFVRCSVVCCPVFRGVRFPTEFPRSFCSQPTPQVGSEHARKNVFGGKKKGRRQDSCPPRDGGVDGDRSIAPVPAAVARPSTTGGKRASERATALQFGTAGMLPAAKTGAPLARSLAPPARRKAVQKSEQNKSMLNLTSVFSAEFTAGRVHAYSRFTADMTEKGPPKQPTASRPTFQTFRFVKFNLFSEFRLRNHYPLRTSPGAAPPD